MARKQKSFFVRIGLPDGISATQRELFAQMLVRLAANFSFQGLADWTVDLPSSVKVLGIEREFHDLTKKGKMNAELRAYFAQTKDARAYAEILRRAFGDVKITGPFRLGQRDWLKAWRKHYKPVHFREGGVRLSV